MESRVFELLNQKTPIADQAEEGDTTAVEEKQSPLFRDVVNCWDQDHQRVLFSVLEPGDDGDTLAAASERVTLYEKKNDRDQELFERLISEHNLFPVPVFVSPLALMFHEGKQRSALWSSHDALKFFIRLERSAFDASSLKLAERQKLLARRDAVLNSVLSHNKKSVFPKLFVYPAKSATALEALMMETFHTTVNCLRVLEFTALDLMGIPDDQDKYVTVSVSLMPTDTSLIQPLVDRISPQFNTHVILVQKKHKKLFPQVNFQTMLIDRAWFSTEALSAYYQFSKEWSKIHIRKCARPSCSNMEPSQGAHTGNFNNSQFEITGKTARVPFKVCSACHYTAYCSAECSHGDWKRHKKECNKEMDLSVFNRERLIIGGD